MSNEAFQHSLYPMDTGFYNSLGNYTLESRCGIAAELGFADTTFGHGAVLAKARGLVVLDSPVMS